MRIRVRPYRKGSTSAGRIAEALGGKRLRFEGSKFVAKPGDILINWGNKNPIDPKSYSVVILNDPLAIPPNKLAFYRAHKNLVPPFWTDRELAEKHLALEGNPKVVCRTILNGSGGAGIRVASTPEELIYAKVYVKYIKKMSEFRIHFVGDDIIFAQQKKLRNGEENANFLVRNHDNGFVYCHQDIDIPWPVTEICEEFVDQTSLDFGAIDVVYNSKREKAYILEVNTAPGLEGDTTLERYKEGFQRLIDRGFSGGQQEILFR